LDAFDFPSGKTKITFDDKRATFLKRRFWILDNTEMVKVSPENVDFADGSFVTVVGFPSISYKGVTRCKM